MIRATTTAAAVSTTTMPTYEKNSTISNMTIIDKQRLERLLMIEKNYLEIIAHGAQTKIKNGITGSVNQNPT